jgi:H+-transporting ATPase
MRSVLVLATALGAMGVLETFLLLGLADTLFGLDRDTIRTLIYLKLSVSGHLTIFVTRTRDRFWARPAPAPLLLGAVLGTQAIATVIAGLGLLMSPLGWRWVAVVWAYALFWFLVEDRVKLLTHAVLDRRRAREHEASAARSIPEPVDPDR